VHLAQVRLRPEAPPGRQGPGRSGGAFASASAVSSRNHERSNQRRRPFSSVILSGRVAATSTSNSSTAPWRRAGSG
jgi:hypothetical protein